MYDKDFIKKVKTKIIKIQIMKIFRQGDLLIMQVNKIPQKGKLQKDNILALGEHTGHSHRITTKENVVYDFANQEMEINGQKFQVMKGFSLSEPSELIHDEHNTITLPVGDFVVIQEKEHDYFSGEIKKVQD